MFSNNINGNKNKVMIEQSNKKSVIQNTSGNKKNYLIDFAISIIVVVIGKLIITFVFGG